MKAIDRPQTSDRRGHLANVVPLHRPVVTNPAHPSCLPAREPYDGERDPLPLPLYRRQLLATEVLSWKSGLPTGERIDAVVAMLLGDDEVPA